ncbi:MULTISPECIES: hypothetical protein [Pseudomonas]|uniref:Uncharacterized protein n=1 Tax=Pseudomonas nitroreducens TaxID=46680 RepID=A0A6G6J1N7_PSENT|nr:MULTISPECIES: hypothetical protein [Pseudomonas]MBG6286897.1 hypothetical protein [Pseudomonas nitroreducens]NMZ58098.1 hypothetical protein [Pseudomonas nitroreducens]QIE89258.1 hypothetical protein G5B91_24550 [Pseudomonas nitroreducens]WEW97861.1 hypothetical protein P3T65_27170 [Pseudomonas nitroreducens]
MKDLVFEKVGDIHSEYPYLCVYFSEEKEPFMEISVAEDRSLEFVVYSRALNLYLSAGDLREILSRGAEFLPEALENGDFS